MNTTFSIFKKNSRYDFRNHSFKNEYTAGGNYQQSNQETHSMLYTHFLLLILTVVSGLLIAIGMFIAVAKFLLT